MIETADITKGYKPHCRQVNNKSHLPCLIQAFQEQIQIINLLIHQEAEEVVEVLLALLTEPNYPVD